MDAKIVSIASFPSMKDFGKFVVTTQDDTGLSGQKIVRKLELNCRVGDTVKAAVRGISLTLDKSACIRG